MISILIQTHSPHQYLSQKFSIDTSQPSVDDLIIDAEKSVKIKHIRELSQFTHTRPTKKPYKSIVFPAAEKLTLPAQHALLKSLEEPPSYLQYILCIPHPDHLLDTIRSRCRLIRHQAIAQNKPKKKYTQLLQQLTHASLAKQFNLAQEHGNNRANASACVEQLTLAVHQQFRQQPNSQHAKLLKQLHVAKRRLEQNVNPKLTLEHLFASKTW